MIINQPLGHGERDIMTKNRFHGNDPFFVPAWFKRSTLPPQTTKCWRFPCGIELLTRVDRLQARSERGFRKIEISLMGQEF
jgi:hypothetical protein